jgi:hypothetical protein
MSADVEVLRGLLHRSVDLLCDRLAATGRVRAVAPVVHDVNDLDQRFAANELAKSGWLPKRAGGKR